MPAEGEGAVAESSPGALGDKPGWVVASGGWSLLVYRPREDGRDQVVWRDAGDLGSWGVSATRGLEPEAGRSAVNGVVGTPWLPPPGSGLGTGADEGLLAGEGG